MPTGDRACRDRSAGERATRRGYNLRGYNLVVLAVTVTLLNIWVATNLPLWSHQIQRDKEAELIFRGMQYAEAIRVFQARFNRYPTSLKELIEVEPRCIRQLWENPMREDGRWGLIPVGLTPGQGNPVQPAGIPGQPGQGAVPGQPGGDLQGGTGLDDPFDSEDGTEEGEEPGVILSADPDDTFAQPASIAIRGVYSPTTEEAIRVWNGKESIREWHFTAELVSAQKQGTGADQGLVTPFLGWEIGKPWPPGVTPQVPQPSSEPQQQPPGQGQPGQPGSPGQPGPPGAGPGEGQGRPSLPRIGPDGRTFPGGGGGEGGGEGRLR